MENKELPAFANPGSDQGPGSSGLTKREYFAAMAMQGLCANSIPGSQHMTKNLVQEAIEYADELLKQLER